MLNQRIRLILSSVFSWGTLVWRIKILIRLLAWLDSAFLLTKLPHENADGIMQVIWSAFSWGSLANRNADEITRMIPSAFSWGSLANKNAESNHANNLIQHFHEIVWQLKYWIRLRNNLIRAMLFFLPWPNSINDIVFYQLNLDYKLKYSLIILPKQTRLCCCQAHKEAWCRMANQFEWTWSYLMKTTSNQNVASELQQKCYYSTPYNPAE